MPNKTSVTVNGQGARIAALPALGTTAQQWASSEDFEQLRAYVEDLTREADQSSEVAAAAGEAYEGLRSCLPSVH
jgi:hypothetical protein